MVEKIGIWIPLLNVPGPTEAGREALKERRRVAARDMPAAMYRIDHLAEPITRAVLDLHRRRPSYDGWTCDGCDFSGYDAEPPTWPCSTVVVIAKAYEIDLEDFWLFKRPDDGSLDQVVPNA